MKRTLDNCKLVKEYGKPRQRSGECDGFQRGEYDDEPCEICKKCNLCSMGYHKESETNED